MTRRNVAVLVGCVGLLACAALALWNARRPLVSAPIAVQKSAAPETRSAREIDLAELKAAIPGVIVNFDALGLPSDIHSLSGFLTGPKGSGGGVPPAFANAYAANDPHRAVKAFLDAHKALFGYDGSVLKDAEVTRDYVNAHNGMRTHVFRQAQNGVPVFNALILANVTADGSLVNLGSQFIPNVSAVTAESVQVAELGDPVTAARGALEAVLKYALNAADAGGITPHEKPSGNTQRQTFTAKALKGEASAELTWMPVSDTNVRLAWDVIFTDRASGEMQRVVVDAGLHQTLSHTNLTSYSVSKDKALGLAQLAGPATAGASTHGSAMTPALASFASAEINPSSMISRAASDPAALGPASTIRLNVFTSESPTPFFPAFPAFQTGPQPTQVARTQLTLNALNTLASPVGWIDSNFETRGNNVDAHLDLNADNIPDLPRPHGIGTNPVVFDFPMDLTQSPSTYQDASTTQLFYWCNFMHDKMYDFGFTEAAGNFQNSNFGRGGKGSDAVQANNQVGGQTNTLPTFSTPPDGSPGRLQTYLWSSSSPNRDGSLDGTLVCNAYAHGIGNRLVGGGALISQLQSKGLVEGWSDFTALSLLVNSSLDVNGTYPIGAYASMNFEAGNYYTGVRRYPYCREPGPIVNAASKNPLTFANIIANSEVHQQGEVWCSALWECRTLLILKYAGTATDGGKLMLQLVIDGMKLSPANPTFTQARDAILQADMADNAGANQQELWTGFAKRGLGFSAVSGANTTTAQVVEAYDVPGDLKVQTFNALSASGPVGGPFAGKSTQYTLKNANVSAAINWSALNTQSWLSVSPPNGTIPANGTAIVTVALTPGANALALGSYFDTVTFTLGSGIVQTRPVSLRVLNTVTSIADTFDTGIDLTQWSAITGISSPNFGTQSPAAIGNSLWFTNGISRLATSAPMNTTGGGVIKFSLFIGQTTYPQDLAEAGKDVVLEYSTDGGTTYTPITTYLTTSVTSWKRIIAPIPAGAMSALTYFRWRQTGAFAADLDNWALDNVFIGPDTAPSPTVTLEQAAGQADPTRVGSINFTATFNVPVFNLTSAGVVLGGTAGANTAVVTGSGTTWNIAVSGMSSSGTVTASLNAGAAVDIDTNPSASSTSVDNTVTYVLPSIVVWSGGSPTSDNWSDDLNWGGGVHPNPGDTIVFAGATRLTPVNDLPAGTLFNAIQFSGGGFNVSGNALQLFASSPLTNAVGTNTLGVNITALNTPAINVSSSTILNLSGGWSSASGLNLVGPGKLVLSGTNTYAGSTTISKGTLAMGAVNALPAATTVSLSNTTLDFSDGTNAYSQVFAGIAGTGTCTNSVSTTATFTDSGTVNQTFLGNMTGALNYLKTGSSAVTFGGTNSYTGTTTVSGGTLIAATPSALGTNSTPATVTGGTLQIGSGVTSLKPIILNGGTLSASSSVLVNGGLNMAGPGTVQVDSGNMTVAGLTGSGALRKINPGTFAPTGVTTYNGAISVYGGAFTINSAIPCPVTVFSSGVLKGSGTLGDVTLSGGTLSPGLTSANPGVINTGNFTCDANSTLSLALNNSTAGNFSQVKVTGTVTLNNCAILAAVAGTVPINTPITVIDNDASDAVIGQFAGAGEGTILPALARVDYVGGTGNDVTLTKIQPTVNNLSNNASITINDNAATPYPSTILVSGVTLPVIKVTATLTGFTHSYMSDVYVLLVGPKGQHIFLMSGDGGSNNVTGENYTFDDAATGYIPSAAAVASGTYKPSLDQGGSLPAAMPANAPTGSTGATLSMFNSLDPNGTWSLYVFDAVTLNTGVISGGWSLQLSLGPPSGTLSLGTPSLNNSVINEGDSVTVSGTFTDTNTTNHSVSIDWGDGTPAGVVSLPSNVMNYSIPHVYGDDTPVNTAQDNFTIATTLSDGLSSTNTTSVVTVKNVAPFNLTAGFDPPALARGASTSVTLNGAFSDPSTGDVHNVTINWGDGTTDKLVLGFAINNYVAAHTYADNQTLNSYIIAVTSADDDTGVGNGMFALPYVALNPAPVISGAPSGLLPGVAVNLTGSATEPGTHTISLAWQVTLNGASFATGTGANFSFTPTADGAYVVTLSGTDEASRIGTASASYLMVGALPAVVIAGAPATLSPGVAVSLTGSASEPTGAHTFTLAWQVTRNATAFASGTGTSFSFTPNPDGAYVVALSATDETGRTGTASIPYKLAGAAPVATITGAPAIVSPGVAVNLTGSAAEPTGTHAFTFTWSVTRGSGTFATGTGTSFSFTPNPDGAYGVTLTATDETGRVGTSSLSYKLVGAVPIVAISGAPAVLAPGVAVNLTGSATEPTGAHTFTLAWAVTRDGGAFASGAGSSFTFTPKENGTYAIALTATDETARVGKASLSFSLAVPPTVVSALTATPYPAVVATPVTMTSTVTSSTALHWFWNFGDGSTNDGTVGSITHAFSPVGTYTFTLTTTDAGGLATLQTASVSVIAAPAVPLDSDGDGFPDAIEIALGSDPLNIASTPFGNGPVTPAPLTIASLSTALDFTHDNKDSLMLKGSLTLPMGTKLEGLKCAVDVGGAVQVFILSKSGTSSTANGQFKLTLAKKAATPSTFQVSFKAVSLRNALRDAGFVNDTVTNVKTSVFVTLALDPVLLQASQTQIYSAKKNKSGKSKDGN